MSNAFSKIDPDPYIKYKFWLAKISLDQPSQKAITFPNDGLFTGHRSIAYGFNTPSAVYSTSLPLDSY